MTSTQEQRRDYYARNRDAILMRRALRRGEEAANKREHRAAEEAAGKEHLCVNGARPPKPGVPIEVAVAVVRKWCDENRIHSTHPQATKQTLPFTVLAELSGIPARRMHDLFYGKTGPTSGFSSGVVSLEEMDKIVTLGMDQPDLWHCPPLDLYYLPIDEWTDEMRARYAAA